MSSDAWQPTYGKQFPAQSSFPRTRWSHKKQFPAQIEFVLHLPCLDTLNKPALGTVGWFPSHPMARTVYKEAADILYSHKDPLVAEILRWYSMVQRIAFTYPSQWLISLITQLNGKLLGWKGYLCKELSISTLLILPNLESSQWFARYQGGTPSVPSAWLYHRMAILKCSPIWLQLCENAAKAWIGRIPVSPHHTDLSLVRADRGKGLLGRRYGRFWSLGLKLQAFG